MLRHISILTLCLALVGNAGADFTDGNDLVEDMREFEKAEQSNPSTDNSRAAEFSAYVIGVYDRLEVERTVCASFDTTGRQVNLIVVKFINEHPERWSEPAVDLVTNALEAALPCS